MAELSDQDKKYLEEARIRAEKESAAFFEFHGLREDEIKTAHVEYRAFLEEDSMREGGKSFFNSPLGRKAFIVGFCRGKTYGR